MYVLTPRAPYAPLPRPQLSALASGMSGVSVSAAFLAEYEAIQVSPSAGDVEGSGLSAVTYRIHLAYLNYGYRPFVAFSSVPGRLFSPEVLQCTRCVSGVYRLLLQARRQGRLSHVSSLLSEHGMEEEAARANALAAAGAQQLLQRQHSSGGGAGPGDAGSVGRRGTGGGWISPVRAGPGTPWASQRRLAVGMGPGAAAGGEAGVAWARGRDSRRGVTWHPETWEGTEGGEGQPGSPFAPTAARAAAAATASSRGEAAGWGEACSGTRASSGLCGHTAWNCNIKCQTCSRALLVTCFARVSVPHLLGAMVPLTPRCPHALAHPDHASAAPGAVTFHPTSTPYMPPPPAIASAGAPAAAYAAVALER